MRKSVALALLGLVLLLASAAASGFSVPERETLEDGPVHLIAGGFKFKSFSVPRGARDPVLWVTASGGFARLEVAVGDVALWRGYLNASTIEERVELPGPSNYVFRIYNTGPETDFYLRLVLEYETSPPVPPSLGELGLALLVVGLLLWRFTRW